MIDQFLSLNKILDFFQLNQKFFSSDILESQHQIIETKKDIKTVFRVKIN